MKMNAFGHRAAPYPSSSRRYPTIRLVFLCLFTGVLWWTGSGEGARAQATRPPEEVFDSASVNLSRQDWAGFAEYLHPTALKQFVFYLLKVTEIRTNTGAGDQAFDVLFGRPTVDEIKAADPAVLFSNFLRSAAEEVPEFGHLIAGSKYKTLGVVKESNVLSHLVVRRQYIIGDTMTERVEVITAEKDRGQWKLHLFPSMVTLLDEIGLPKLK